MSGQLQGDPAGTLGVRISSNRPAFREQLNTATDIDFEPRIRQVLRDHGRLNKSVDELAPGSDLYQCGMTSHASVNVMLALESAFDVEFPDQMLKRSVFQSIDAIRDAVVQLTSG